MDKWTPKTRVGWFFKNTIDKTLGPGVKEASMSVKAPGIAAGRAAKPILSTDISATIAQAAVAASGKSSQALISGKGLDAKSMDLGR